MANMKKGILLVILVAVLLSSCRFSRTYSNEESVKNEAYQVVEKFYQAIEKQDWDETIKYFSPKFLEVSPSEKSVSFLKEHNFRTGNYHAKRIIDWGTYRAQVNAVSKAEAFFLMEASYKEGDYAERIGLMKEKGVFKIVSYNIESKE